MKEASILKYWTNLLAIETAVLILSGQPAAGADWPTLHKGYQRSGYTEEVVRGPYERKWYRDFHDEMITTRNAGSFIRLGQA